MPPLATIAHRHWSPPKASSAIVPQRGGEVLGGRFPASEAAPQPFGVTVDPPGVHVLVALDDWRLSAA